MTTKFFVPRADRRLGERYELNECLGDGSYGWVWRAQRLSRRRRRRGEDSEGTEQAQRGAR